MMSFRSPHLPGFCVAILLSSPLRAEEPVNIWVFGAGTIHTAFELGAARVFFEETGRGPDIVVGTSGGSINAAFIAQGFERSRSSIDGLDNIEKEWRRIRGKRDFYQEEPWFADLSDLMRGPLLAFVNNQEGINDYFALLKAGNEIKNDLKTVSSGQSKSIYNLSPLISRLRQPGVLRNKVLAPRLLIATVDLETTELRWIDGDGIFYDENFRKLEIPQVALNEAVIASAAIPVLFPPHSLNGRLYMDGGVREYVPTWAGVHAAREEYPGRPVSIYLATPHLQRPAPVKPAFSMTIADVLEQTIDALVSETTERAINPYPDGWGVPLHVVRPRLTLPSSLNADPGLIAIYIDYGYMRAADELRLEGDMRQAATELTDDIVRLRLSVWAKEEHFLQSVITSGHVNYWNQSSLDEIRHMKQQVQAATLRRHSLESHVTFPPTLTQRWWWDWEDHDWKGSTIPHSGPGVDPWCNKTSATSANWPLCQAATKPPRVSWVPDSVRQLRIDVTPDAVRAQDVVQVSVAAMDSASGTIQTNGVVYVGGVRYDLTGQIHITHAFHADVESSTIIAVAPGYPATSHRITVGLIPVQASAFFGEDPARPALELGVPTVVTISARDDRGQPLSGKVVMRNPGQAGIEFPLGTQFKWTFRVSNVEIPGHSVPVYTTGQVVVDSDHMSPRVDFGFPSTPLPLGPIEVEPEPSDEGPTVNPRPPVRR